VKIQYLKVQGPKDIDTAIRAAGKGHAEALFVPGGAIIISQRARIIESAAKNRLPAIYHRSEFVDDGGLMYYGVNLADLSRRAAMVKTFSAPRAELAPAPEHRSVSFA
jgi:putative ABC transport system substrate-binding protein